MTKYLLRMPSIVGNLNLSTSTLKITVINQTSSFIFLCVCFCHMFQDGRIVPGAGATEIELARHIGTFGEVSFA